MVTSAYVDDLQIHGGSTYKLREATLGAPAPRAVTDVKPNDHGAVDATNYYGPRSIELSGYVVATSFDAMWDAVDELKGKLALGSSHTFKFQRQGRSFEEQVIMRVDSSVDILAKPMPSPMIEWGVSLFCADPRLYSATLSTGSYDPTTSGTAGLVFPLTFPLGFGSAGAGAYLTVDNQGNVDSPPTFTIQGPVTNPIIDNDSIGKSIYCTSLALTSSDYLTISTADKTVYLNGTTSRPDLIDASQTVWFNLQPGINQLRLRGSSMSAGTTSLGISFRSARI